MTQPSPDPEATSWVAVPDGSDFTLHNLPYGIFSHDSRLPRVGVAIGDHVLDLAALAEAGLFDGVVPEPLGAFGAPSLNAFLVRGREQWAAARRRIADLLRDDNDEVHRDGLAGRALVPRPAVELHLPFVAGDYVDFYSSREHATNVGRMFRPDGEPLAPNWHHLPVGYHGRTATIVVSGTPVTRPVGQRGPAEDGGAPRFGPSRRLDFELEVGFVTGPGNPMGTPIAVDDAADHVFGFVLVNDWSARDIQAWEYRPLGPFLGKSFATSVSPWVVPLDALEPYRVASPPQDPEPLDYLRATDDWGVDLELEAWLRPQGGGATRLSRTNFSRMYWTAAQQLAHVTSNGASVRPGDLFASGTVSGREPGTYGSMIELTWNGEQPMELEGNATRTFLEDGDTVVLRGWCGGGGRPRVGLGEVSGTILPAAT